MPLSDHIDSQGGGLSEEDKTFFDTLPPFVYKDSGESFKGVPKTIVFSDPIQFYDSEGRELLPKYPPQQPKKDFLRA